MKKIVIIASVLIILALLVSCDTTNGEQNMFDDGTQETAKMTAIVNAVGDKIEVEVIEGDYGVSGLFWVNFSSDTVFVGANNQKLKVSDLKAGDTIEITYSGQVALSYPPQIFAKRIQIK